jgi:tripartite motif-containing protein 71
VANIRRRKRQLLRCGLATGDLLKPRALAVASDGDVYVVDTGNYRIQRLGSTGALLAVWGSRGSGPGEFENASDTIFEVGGRTAVTIGPNGHVFALDVGNSRICRQESKG